MKEDPFKEYRKAPTERKFQTGQIVIINKMLVGMVFAAYWHINSYIYRLIVDGREAAYRLRNKHFEEQDRFLFQEDISSFLFQTEGITVIEVDENELTQLEDVPYFNSNNNPDQEAAAV